MVIGLSLNQSIAIPCSLCKRTKCGADCLLQRHRTLSSQQKHIQCANCHAHDVDINVDDYYECRKCHTQYTTAPYDDSWERVLLVIDMDAPILQGGVVTALVHPTKGEGKIDIDQALQEIEKEMEALKTKRGRRRKN